MNRPGESAIKVGNAGDGGEPAGASPGANASQWDVFEGHAFAAGHLTPDGLLLVACLGGCEAGYVSDPVTVGSEGRYAGLKVAREQSDADAGVDGDVVTFWLVGEENRVRADQAVLFLGSAQTRKLHLSFAAVPSVPGVEEQEEVAAAPVDEPPRWFTTDLTVPNPADLGLLPSDSPQAFAATTFRIGGRATAAGVRNRAGIAAGADRRVGAPLPPPSDLVSHRAVTTNQAGWLPRPLVQR